MIHIGLHTLLPPASVYYTPPHLRRLAAPIVANPPFRGDALDASCAKGIVDMITKQTIFNEAQRQKQMQEQEKIILYDAVLEVLADANLLGNPQHEGKLAPELVQELIDTARGWEKTAGMYRRLATQRVEAVKGASRSPIIARSNRVPIRPIADNSGGRFSAEHEINELKQVIRQLTDYVNELRRDVDTLQGYGD